jgi:hypothetical protein
MGGAGTRIRGTATVVPDPIARPGKLGKMGPGSLGKTEPGALGAPGQVKPGGSGTMR